MTSDAAHTRWWQIFEVIFGIPFLAALALHMLMPFSFPRGSLTPAITGVGGALIVVGMALVTLARRAFARHRQPTDPSRPTTALITTGVFSISRNPLYLGGVCVLVGLALVLNIPWIVVLLLPAMIACQSVLIAPEERYLATKFGADYRTYAASVHRWIGRARQPT
jgi:protein-S-isoprenylcysteine O-methyltransferase Ste14